MTTKIVGLDGKEFVPEAAPAPVDPSAPIPELVTMLEDVVERAKRGQIRSLVGCGMTDGGQLYTIVAEGPVKSPDTYAILGGLRIVETIYAEMILMATTPADETDGGVE